MNNAAFENFCKDNNIKYKINEPMKEHTSFKIGGPADYFIIPDSREDLIKVLKAIKEFEIPLFILGKGSNLLVSDKGISGAVISLAEMNNITVKGEEIICESGVSLATVCQKAKENSLEGLEFAFGIPGSIGGALYMNAGAYGGEMSQVVSSAEYVTASGDFGEIKASDMKLGYRTSIFKAQDKIIVSVTLKLKKGNLNEIQEKMDDYLSRRKDKQPLNFPSAGSTFKRPTGYFAGALIEKNNLKGYSFGGAMVSEKHAGFIINYNNASCEDVRSLMRYVLETVYNADNVLLEPEVIFVGKE